MQKYSQMVQDTLCKKKKKKKFRKAKSMQSQGMTDCVSGLNSFMSQG